MYNPSAFGAGSDGLSSDYDAAQKLLDEISNEVSNVTSMTLTASDWRFLIRLLDQQGS